MGRFSRAAEEAAHLTDNQLETEIAALGTLSREDVRELLPQTRDKEAFLSLMRELESEKTEDENLAYLKGHLETAGRVALKVLKALV